MPHLLLVLLRSFIKQNERSLQWCQIRQFFQKFKTCLSDLGFIVLPLTENIGHRALIYIEEYSLSYGLRAGDAVIAATAAENKMILVSSNARHLKSIKDLRLKAFKP